MTTIDSRLILYGCLIVAALLNESKMMIQTFNAKGSEAFDKGSKYINAVVILSALIIAPFIALNSSIGGLPNQPLTMLSGVLVVVFGMWLRQYCFRLLGKSFTAAVNARSDQTVVDWGIYRYIRHPSYLAGLILAVGLGLALANGILILVLAGLYTSAILYRITVEEQALVETIGAPYVNYKKRTKSLIPFIF